MKKKLGDITAAISVSSLKAAIMERPWFEVANVGEVASPALLVYPERVRQNIQRMLDLVGGAAHRLRPHVKTHKLAPVVRMQLEAGIAQFKAATIAECEMASRAGALDVLLAYQPVGPTAKRLLKLAEKDRDTLFSTVVDNLDSAAALSAVFAKPVKKGNAGTLPVYVDLDCGQHRTGISVGPEALDLCNKLATGAFPGLEFGGLHVYDGHIHDPGQIDRQRRFVEAIAPVESFITELQKNGTPVPLVIGGGSPTFALHSNEGGSARTRWQCSPGTTLFWDAGYGENFPDLGFVPAAALLTRIISKPTPNRVCLDLGHKSVAAENPLERRVRFLNLPDAELAKPVAHSEEHLVLELPEAAAADLRVGQEIYGLPWHICPTVNLHGEAVVVENREVVETWPIDARNRKITI